MAKFYVESGSMQLVLCSQDAESAALWMVHRVMEDLTDIYEDGMCSEEQRLDSIIVESLLDLGPEITVSEVGFGRDEAGKMDTFDIVMYWHQLMTALQRLESRG